LKVLEFYFLIFQASKVLENGHGPSVMGKSNRDLILIMIESRAVI